MKLRIAVSIAILLCAPAAQAAAPAQAFPMDQAIAHCSFVTHDCEMCSVRETGEVSCTTQGLACVPTKHWCLVPETGRKASNE